MTERDKEIVRKSRHFRVIQIRETLKAHLRSPYRNRFLGKRITMHLLLSIRIQVNENEKRSGRRATGDIKFNLHNHQNKREKKDIVEF